MVLESTFTCVDNSSWMRNGDFVPTRLASQQDAVHLVAQSKLRSNPENNVGLLAMADLHVLSGLTTDSAKLMAKMAALQPGNKRLNFNAAIKIAHLALKHRQGKNHKPRIVAFVGSPLEEKEEELVTLAKKLKKEKVAVDVISFGEDDMNSELLTKFIETVNGSGGGNSHLVTIKAGTHLSDALISSPIVQGEDGSGAGAVVATGGGGFEFGVDPNDDPELALALRVSMEEQRQRQEAESREGKEENSEKKEEKVSEEKMEEDDSEEALLQRALAMSVMGEENKESKEVTDEEDKEVDLNAMTEEEQIAYAMKMSMQESEEMEVDNIKKEEANEDAINDPAYVQSVLENLPGVDHDSEEVKAAKAAIKEQMKKNNEDKDKGTN